MADYIIIDRLIVHSPAQEDAIIEFTRGLNVISGPSDSGKSYLLDLIDFMFGASSLRRRIPEIEPYSYVIMHITINGFDFEQYSIARNIDGERYEIRSGHVLDTGIAGGPSELSRTHNPKSLDNLSNFLLDKIGLAGKVVKRNARNATRSLSFRDLAHLSIIDETSMQSAVSPVTPTGQYATRTAEASVFSLLLEGEDDSGLVETAPTAEERRLSDSRTRLLDSVVALLEDQAPAPGPIGELRDQLDRLSESISAEGSAIEQLILGRDAIAERRVELAQALENNASEFAELNDLFARFSLLARQYTSDLERLEMIAEAGTLLALSNPDVCVLCGAATEHQNWHLHQAAEVTSLGDAVDAEKAKIARLASDLDSTIKDVRSRGLAVQSEGQALRRELAELANQLRDLDSSLRPNRVRLRELVDKRSSVERALTVQEHIAAVDALRAKVAAREAEISAAAKERPSPIVLDEFGKELVSALGAWRVQGATSIRYDRSERDFVIGGRPRASRGKGMRALQHAAFSVALARYCADRDLPFTGFVILDSPLVTYREPDHDEPTWSDEDQQTTTEAFYADLSTNTDLQIIVIENVPPPINAAGPLNHIAFTRNPRDGRVGLFPSTVVAE
jgi:hypothetical protein